MNMINSITPLLQVENLSIGFGSLDAVKGVSFQVGAGEVLGIVGESGSGKSLTCRALMGLLPGARIEGAVRLEGQNLLGLGEGEWRSIRGRELGMIFQNPASHLDPLRRIGTQVAAPIVRHLGVNKSEGMHRAVRLLEDVGIHEAKTRARSYPHEFSGGMKQRAMIAAAIGCGPKLLIADEPTTALDVTVQARILKLLQDLNRDRGIAIILISHDLAAIATICSRVVVMRNGEIVEQGPVQEIIGRPQHPYTQTLIASQPSRWSKSASLATPLPATPLLSVEQLSVSFPVRGSFIRSSSEKHSSLFRALDGIDLQIAAGETVGIVGESGSGKSTLARTLVRQNSPSAGVIRFDGSDVHALEGKDLIRFRQRVQMVFQNPYDSLNPRMSVRDAIAEPLWRHGLTDRHTAQVRANELLELVELPSALRDRRPRQLSGGQCQRVGLARALALQPELLIADEITSALDVTTQAQILELLGRLQREQRLALLYISHDLAVVNSICQRVYVFKGGRIVETGPTQQVLSRPQDPYTRELVGSVTHRSSNSHALQGCPEAPLNRRTPIG